MKEEDGKGQEGKPVTLFQQFIHDIDTALENKVKELHSSMDRHVERANEKLDSEVRVIVKKMMQELTGVDGSWSRLKVEPDSLARRMVEKKLGAEFDKVLTKKIKQEVLKVVNHKSVEKELYSMVQSKISARIIAIAENLATKFVNGIYNANFVIQDGEIYINVDGEIKPLTIELLKAKDDQLEVIKEQAKTEAYVARLEAKIDELQKLKRDVEKGNLDKVPVNLG